MKSMGLLGALVVVLAAATANAAIVDWNCDADGDGAITCQSSLTGAAPDYTLTMTENMYWAPGHAEGTIETDTALDPSILFNKNVTNNTSYAWSGYKINMFMQQPFSIDGAGPMPLGWTASVTPVNLIAGSFADSHGNPFGYKGSVVFTNVSGSDVGIGQTGNFGALASFSGYFLYTFELEQIATPEPATLALVALGGLLLVRRRTA